MSTSLWFATSNVDKFREADLVLKNFGIELHRLASKGTEVQSDDVAVIASRAAVETHTRWRKPLIVEDTGLYVAPLNGFPGPYASYVNQTIGPPSLLTLMGARKERDAEFITVVAFCEGSRPRLFRGKLKGTISWDLRGTEGFGFDPVFVPKGSLLTLAEMSLEEKASVSHRTQALMRFGQWFRSRRGR